MSGPFGKLGRSRTQGNQGGRPEAGILASGLFARQGIFLVAVCDPKIAGGAGLWCATGILAGLELEGHVAGQIPDLNQQVALRIGDDFGLGDGPDRFLVPVGIPPFQSV